MRTGLELLELSKGNPEPNIDEAYENERLIITTNPGESNQLMAANRGVLDLITAFKICENQGDTEACERHIKGMLPLLKIKGMNFSEFASYWSTLDVSHSVYIGYSNERKILFLRRSVRKYIENRHNIYQSHGYTFSTLQVKADAHGHKRHGGSARSKMEKIFIAKGFIRLSDVNLLTKDCQNIFSFPDKDRFVFKKALELWGSDFVWKKQEKGKIPDFIIVTNGHLYIGEHKHMKESGGGQDKQMLELISLIEQDETNSNVHYVSFLDGIKFNKLMNSTRRGKALTHRESIQGRLASIPQNYFVNTAGFQALLSDLVAGD
ncbi:MAG: hypothetical protein JKX70_11415 [Phycisphaerales bacterium]|nr:hypothetical protein [Phycisphaerales bacterium]